MSGNIAAIDYSVVTAAAWGILTERIALSLGHRFHIIERSEFSIRFKPIRDLVVNPFFVR